MGTPSVDRQTDRQTNSTENMPLCISIDCNHEDIKKSPCYILGQKIHTFFSISVMIHNFNNRLNKNAFQ